MITLVLLVVVFGNNLLVVLLEVGSQGVLLKQSLQSFLYDLAKVLDCCVLDRASLELLLEPIKVDLLIIVMAPDPR